MRIDALFRLRVDELSDRGHTPGLDRKVARIPRRAGAVDDVAVADDEVIRLGPGAQGEEE